MDLWEFVINWIRGRKKAIHTFPVCSSQKVVIPGSAEGNIDEREASGAGRCQELLHRLNPTCLHDSQVKCQED